MNRKKQLPQDGELRVLCDDNNVQHCPTVKTLADGRIEVSSTQEPGKVAVLTTDEYATLLRLGATA